MLSNKSNGMVTPRKVVWLAFFLSKSLYNKKQTDNNKLYTRPLWYKTLRIGYPPPPPFPSDLERYIYQSNYVQNDTILKVIYRKRINDTQTSFLRYYQLGRQNFGKNISVIFIFLILVRRKFPVSIGKKDNVLFRVKLTLVSKIQ